MSYIEGCIITLSFPCMIPGILPRSPSGDQFLETPGASSDFVFIGSRLLYLPITSSLTLPSSMLEFFVDSGLLMIGCFLGDMLRSCGCTYTS